MIPTNRSSLGRAGCRLRRYPGGTENASIFAAVRGSIRIAALPPDSALPRIPLVEPAHITPRLSSPALCPSRQKAIYCRIFSQALTRGTPTSISIFLWIDPQVLQFNFTVRMQRSDVCLRPAEGVSFLKHCKPAEAPERHLSLTN